ncbi:protein arginine N-methyltransferase 2-like [Vulpes vulpes]|uniref:Protein arginine N-methyltransferase 2-like n=1 Tax=Vulpes vulpes TaxID=9627 RepID=A0ABM5AEW0_VULVU
MSHLPHPLQPDSRGSDLPALRKLELGVGSLGTGTTHWRQVLFMMDEPVSVLSGDVVTGSVVLQRNPVWRRHMSVALSWSVTSTQDPTSQKVGEKVFPIWR